MYSKWYLNFALWLRSKIRAVSFNKRLTQYGAVTEPFISFLETLLDIRHQETFSATIPNRAAQKMKEILNYNVPSFGKRK